MVTGCFDPVLAGHARRLREIREGFDTLIVVLSEPAQPVLDARARAEVLAALAAVDYVVLPPVDLGQDPGLTIFDEQPADQVRFERLVEHVRQRYHLPVSR